MTREKVEYDTGRHFYGTENLIWAGLGPIMRNFWGRVFMFSGANFFLKMFWKCFIVSTEKLRIINLRKNFKKNFASETRKKRSQLGLNSQSIVYCSIGHTSLRDFYIMTLIITFCSLYQISSIWNIGVVYTRTRAQKWIFSAFCVSQLSFMQMVKYKVPGVLDLLKQDR